MTELSAIDVRGRTRAVSFRVGFSPSKGVALEEECEGRPNNFLALFCKQAHLAVPINSALLPVSSGDSGLW